MKSAEHERLQSAEPWRDWGPYVAERAWGTVREDYSADGSAWTYFPHDHARSRAYRWNEDGMAAVCDVQQSWCLALALWNGVDPILKARMFGLSGPEGNHGEDAKEYWWYLDSTPTHSWMTWRYHYPQREFPYGELVAENARRGAGDPEYELIDTGVFADASWMHLSNADVISMPDPWEYPWYAAWDLAFHCVPIAHVDPEFAKQQLLLMLREWYMHPNGQIPAYEWSFSDVNPPVHAWAALRVFEIDGAQDYLFLSRVFHKLLLNFTWWVNRKDSTGSNVFEGGFLGLDNIGPIDRSAALPVMARLEQSDGTAWMAMYCLNLLEMALILAEHDVAFEDLATKFFEHFAYIAAALRDMGLWSEADGFFYDTLRFADGGELPLRVKSMVGLLPLCATTTLGESTLARLRDFGERFAWFIENKPQYRGVVGETHVRDGRTGRLLSILDGERLVRILTPMLSDDEFLSPHGLRAPSRRHRDEPFSIDLGGMSYTVDYEPAESTTGLFGGNSNWRGPIWFPVNYLIIEALRRFARFFGDDLVVEHPTGSGCKVTLEYVADDLSRRLIGIFLDDNAGRRPVFGDDELFQTDAAWHDLLPFHEYFHGDTGRGLGASHQTGWTCLVADLIKRRGDES